MKKLNHKIQNGFSLMELMVAMAIMAILSGIAIPLYNDYRVSGNKQECSQEIAIVQFALASFNHDNQALFTGVGSAALQLSSRGYYIPSARFLDGTANCTISVALGPNPNLYVVTATGVNELAGLGVVARVQNF